MIAVIVLLNENVACAKFRVTELKPDLLAKITVVETKQRFPNSYFLNFL